MSRLRLSPEWVAILALGAVTLALPQFLTTSQLTVYVLIGLYTIVTAGLSLLMGFAGQVSLGQGAFYAIGAYTAALLTMDAGAPPVVGLVAAPLVTAAVAALIGLPLLRLRGHYLAFATLAFQLITISVLVQWKALTRGSFGLPGIPPLLPTISDELDFNNPLWYSYLAWFATAAVLLLSRNLVASRPGRALRALATSEMGALASGVPVGRYKLQVFALAAGYAGLAGGIYAYFISFVSPGSFPILLSIEFLVMAIVGGLGSVWGALVGAAAITLLVQLLKGIGEQPGMDPHVPLILNYAVYAVVLILVMLFLPGGLFPALRSGLARLARRRAAAAGAEAPAEA